MHQIGQQMRFTIFSTQNFLIVLLSLKIRYSFDHTLGAHQLMVLLVVYNNNLFQDIDGRSLLLMTRNDVVNGLHLKMGPALKIYGHVKKLQLRRSSSHVLWE